MTRLPPGPVKLMLLFGASSLLAVGLGALVCAWSGVPAALWSRNLAAWLVGAVAAAGLARTGARLLPLALWAAPLGIAATFAGEAQDGVHRWVNAGPISANAAMLVVPAAVVALAAGGARTLWGWAAALTALGFLVLQPDASQATALGSAMALVAIARAPGRTTKAALVAACAALVAASWLRPDPLQPVPEVEQILNLAFERSPILAALALAAVVAAAIAPGVAARSSPSDVRLAGMALALSLVLWTVAPFVGAFPVPLVGIGFSPIVGSWLGAGLLAGLLPRHREIGGAEAPGGPGRHRPH